MPKIIYYDLPPGANEDAEASGSAQSFWDGEVTTERQAAKFATLEPGYWGLDGKSKILPDSPSTVGFWSTVTSDENGDFSSPVQLTVTFPDSYTTTGLTFRFDTVGGGYASHVQSKWYSDTILLAEMQMYPTGPDFVQTQVVEGFNRLELTFYGTNLPRRFLKLEQLLVGQLVTFDQDELREVDVHQEVDILSTSLPGSTLDFTLVDRKNRSIQFQKRQPMWAYERDSLIGVFYLDESQKTLGNIYSVSTKDAINLLSDISYRGGIYDGQSFKTLVNDILGGEFSADIAPELENVPMYGWLPSGTAQEALIQAAFAAGAQVRTAGSDAVRFVVAPEFATSAIQKKRIFSGGKVTTKSRVTQVKVTCHSYRQGSTSEELYSEYTEPGSYTLANTDPYSGYSITGGSITNSGPNFVEFTVSTAQTVVITGMAYQHSQLVISKRNPKTVSSDTSNVVEITDATLVGQHNGKSALQRVFNYYMNREELEETILLDGEEPGDLVTSEKSFDAELLGWVLYRDLRLTGGRQVGSIKLYGKNVELDMDTAPRSGTRHSGEV